MAYPTRLPMNVLLIPINCNHYQLNLYIGCTSSSLPEDVETFTLECFHQFLYIYITFFLTYPNYHKLESVYPYLELTENPHGFSPNHYLFLEINKPNHKEDSRIG